MPRWIVGFCVVAGIGFGQSEQVLAERLANLEARAAKAEALETRVNELEGKLSFYETQESDQNLSAAINALTEDRAYVGVRKAKSILFGGQVRLRTEYRTVTRYQDAAPRETDEDFTIQRTRLNADARLLDHVRAFVEIQDSRTWGEELRVLTDTQGVDLHQGFVDFEDLFGSGATLRTGRFELSLWNQRLISPLDWHPVSRAWDGVLGFGTFGELTVHAGVHTIAEDARVDSDADTDLYWAALTWKPNSDHELGAALFSVDANAGTSDANFQTLTVHAQGRFSGFDYSLDLVGQGGDFEDLDVCAYATAVEVGYTFGGDWKPRVALEWTWASGDDDPTDGDYETFNPLFPFGHYYQGYLDIFGWRNGHDVVAHFQARPSESFWFEVAFHGFWLDQSEDAWYGADLMPIRSFPAADDRQLGYELDISAKYWLSPAVWLWFGYSHFFPGDYVDETGDDPATDWVWLQLTADF